MAALTKKAGRRDIPLYEMVDSLIRQRLVENIYPPGAALPSEMQLARELSVSQGTVRRALDAMVTEGLLYRRQGLGTFVSEMEDRRSLFLFFNMVSKDGQSEMPAAQLISVETAEANAEESRKLDLPSGASVHRLVRLRVFQEQPTILESIVVSGRVFPDLGADAPPPEHLFRHYEEQYGVTVVRAEEMLAAEPATLMDARVLEVAVDSPLLVIDRVAFALDGHPVEWRVSRCNTSHHSYRVIRG